MTEQRRNEYPAKCRLCGQRVAAGAGLLKWEDGLMDGDGRYRYGHWAVQHMLCPAQQAELELVASK